MAKEKFHQSIIRGGLLGFLFLLLFLCLPLRVYSQAPDLILHNGNIITLEDNLKDISAVAVRERKIVTLGADELILKLAGPGTKIIDLKKRVVIPGFIDTHIHIISGGLGMKRVQLGETTSISELQEAVKAYIQESRIPPGEWVIASSDWYVNQLKENRFPTRWELDKVSPRNPVFLPRGAHQSASNSLALKLAGITKDSSAPKGGEIVKDPKTGEPTGTLVDTAQEPIRNLLPKEDEAESLEALRRVQDLAHSLGITSLVEGAATLSEWQIMERFKKSGGLKIRIAARLRAGNKADFLKINKALSPRVGDEWLRTGPIKIILDGGSTGALFSQPYVDKPGFYGVQVTSTEDFKEISELANQNDWRVSIHCNGDKAFDILLSAWEEINKKKSIVGKRWTVEHGKNIRPEQIPRVKALGLLVTIQAAPYVKGETYLTNFGRERADASSPTRDYMNNGIVLAGGSDWLTNPLNPFLHIYFAAARKTKAGNILGARQAMTPLEALAMHTKYGAYVTFEENMKGTLAPGKLADMAVLSQNPLTVTTGEIKDTRVLMTLVGGEVVYKSNDF